MAASSIVYGSVCSGHEAVTQALHGRGWEPRFFAEVEAFPSAVLGQRFGATAPREPLDPASVPKKERGGWLANNRELARIAKRGDFGSTIPNLGDFTKINPAEWADVQWLWGGTPCQDFSVAGLRLGLDGHRGNLTIAFLALAHELAATGSLRGFTWENVPGILSHKRNAFGCFLAAAVGHDAPIISPHGKRRWPDAGVVVGPRCRLAWIIRDTQHFGLPQRRRRVFVVGCFGDGPDPVEILFERQGVRGASAPGTGEGEGITYALAPSLTASGRGVERIGEIRGQDPVVATGHPAAIAFNSREDLVSSAKVFGALGSSSPQAQEVAFSMRGRDGENQIEPEADDVAPALRTGEGGSSKSFVATIGHNITWAVRRLLPTECEALQGTARDFTRIRWRGRPEAECPDGPRYKVIGNSMSVDVIIWLGDRIRSAMVDQ